MSIRCVNACAAAVVALSIAACDDAAPPGTDAVDVVLAGADAGNPTVAVDSRSGTVFASWIETTDGGGNVWIAAIDDSVRSAPVRVNDIDGDAAPHDQAPPQVTIAPDGAVIVAWQNNTAVPGRRFPASNLRLARSTDGGRSFEPAVFVNDDALGKPSSHTFHDIAVATDGTIYVSWIDGRARTLAGGDDGGAVHGAGAGAGVSGSRADGAHAHSGAMPGSEVRVAKSVDGGRTFSPGVIVRSDVCPCCRTSIATAADGTVAVSFRSATGNIRDIMVARSTDGGMTFGAPTPVHDDGWQVESCPHAGASIAFDAAGRLHVAWYTGAPERQGVWYSISSQDDASFAEPTPLLIGGWVPVSQVKLAVDESDNVWVAWDDRRAEQSTVQLASVAGGAVRMVQSAIPGRSPAIDAAGVVALGWQEDAGAALKLVEPR